MRDELGSSVGQCVSETTGCHETHHETSLKATERDNPLMDVLRYTFIGTAQINTTQKLSKL